MNVVNCAAGLIGQTEPEQGVQYLWRASSSEVYPSDLTDAQ